MAKRRKKISLKDKDTKKTIEDVLVRKLEPIGIYSTLDKKDGHGYSVIEKDNMRQDGIENISNTVWKRASIFIIYEEIGSDKSDMLDQWKLLANKIYKLNRYNPIMIFNNDGTEFEVFDKDGNSLTKGTLEEVIENVCILKASALTHTGPKPNRYQGDLGPQIFYGVPGTGKTFHCQTEILDKFEKENKFFITFHQSFCYEDFIEGIKPVLDNTGKDVEYHIEQGIFYEACERAAQQAGYTNLEECLKDTESNRRTNIQSAIASKHTVVLCIDEINRGNISSIFGELITLIETSKRLGAEQIDIQDPITKKKSKTSLELITKLPYSKKDFGVPANLLIVGTMNTADRSIQLLDSALRRRFTFKEYIPEPDKITNPTAQVILKYLNQRIYAVSEKNHRIGHSFLMDAQNNKDIAKAFIYKIIPQLEEYFYEDTDKIRFILNDIDGHVFYKEDPDLVKINKIYNKDSDEDDKSFYLFNEDLKDDTTLTRLLKTIIDQLKEDPTKEKTPTP